VYLNKRKFLPGVSQAKKGDESLKYWYEVSRIQKLQQQKVSFGDCSV
jgi:hypothetical protein